MTPLKSPTEIALPATPHMAKLPPKIPTQNESKTPVAAHTKKTNTKTNTTRMYDGNSIDTKLETTEKNTTTEGMGSVDDLLDLSFSDFNQTPSNAVPPTSFSSFDFSSSAPWS